MRNATPIDSISCKNSLNAYGASIQIKSALEHLLLNFSILPSLFIFILVSSLLKSSKMCLSLFTIASNPDLFEM